MRLRTHVGRRRLAPVLGVAGVLLAGCGLGSVGGASAPPAVAPTSQPATSQPATSQPPVPPAGDVRLAAFGDSITQADGNVPAGELGTASWLSTAATDGVVFAGGWARGGATTADMLAAAEPADADVLVILAGTNDPGAGISAEATAGNLRALVDRVGVERVVLSAVPPRDEAPAVAVATNEGLATLAEQEGWVFADPMAGVRDGDRFAPGMSSDGLHPREEGAAVIGAALRRTVLEVAGR